MNDRFEYIPEANLSSMQGPVCAGKRSLQAEGRTAGDSINQQLIKYLRTPALCRKLPPVGRSGMTVWAISRPSEIIFERLLLNFIQN